MIFGLMWPIRYLWMLCVLSTLPLYDTTHDGKPKRHTRRVANRRKSPDDSERVFSKNDSVIPSFTVYDPEKRALDERRYQALTMMMNETATSRAGGHDDRLLVKIMNHKLNGFFVDLGANHYHHLSNSYMLETIMGWKGVCIEPNEVYLYGLLTQRTCKVVQAVISDTTGATVRFRKRGVIGGIIGEEYSNKAYSIRGQKTTSKGSGVVVGTRNEEELTTVRLQHVLEYLHAPPKMDLLLADIEGGEWAALRSFNFEKYTFHAIIVERPRRELHTHLVAHQYHFLLEKGGDVYYLHKDYPSFHKMMKRFESWHKFARDTPVPSWDGEQRTYLMATTTTTTGTGRETTTTGRETTTTSVRERSTTGREERTTTG